MNTELIIEKYADTTPLSLSVYKNNILIKSYNEQSFFNSLSYQMLEPYFDSDYNVCFLTTPDRLEFGFIRIQENRQIITIGPASPHEPTDRQAENLLNELRLPSDRKRDFLSWFHRIPLMGFDEFRKTLDFLNYIINGTEDEPIRLSYHIPHFVKRTTFPDVPFVDSFIKDTEKIMISCIEQGRYTELEKILEHLSDFSNLPNLGSNELRSLKNSFIASTAIASRSAINGGLDYDTALNLSNYYIAKMENLTLYTDILQLLYTMLLDYTKRISNLQAVLTDSATVTKICRYVNNNLTTKVSVQTIAEALHLNETYISHHFKKNTGMNLTDYISMQKIKEAQHLLETTTLPLSSISERLAFSSQQYFQTVFKKYIGTTPQQYRNQKA